MIDWQTFKCRCSAIGKMMSNSRANPQLTEKQAGRLIELEKKMINSESLTAAQATELGELVIKRANGQKVILSDTCIEYLMQVFSEKTTGKRDVKKELDIDYLIKGKLVEEKSIMLLSIVDDVVYTKNTEQVSNDFLTGEPDIFVGREIMKAKKITDTKSCFDYPSFLKKLNEDLDKGWMEQVQGYMDITGAQDGEVAHCLVNMPEIMMRDYKRKLFYRGGEYATDESPEFLEKWDVLLRSMIFDDISTYKRVHKHSVQPFSKERRQQIYDRVKVCREWLFQFSEMYDKMNLPVVEEKLIEA